jgi:hypothetical protein
MPRLLRRCALAILCIAMPAAAELNTQWIGRWVNRETGQTLDISGATLLFRQPPPFEQRAQYGWTERRPPAGSHSGAAALRPGLYFGYDGTSITPAGIHALLARAWADRAAPVDEAAAAKRAAVDAAIDAIHPGAYRRLRRFCIEDPKAAADCTPVDEDEFFVFDTDHIVQIRLFLVAPEDSEILAYSRR